jgi:hypothetical protein
MPRRSTSGTRFSLLAAMLALIVGVTNPFTVRLVGLMPVSEIVLLFAGVVVLLQIVLSHKLHGQLIREPAFKFLMFCQAVALLGYVISDVWRGSSPSDIMRGWARMIFLAFDVTCMVMLFENLRTFVFYQIGVVISGMHVFVHGALFNDFWKFGFGVPLTVLALLVFPLGGPWLAGLGVIGMAALHWYMDYRSMTLICILLAALQWLAALPRAVRQVLFSLSVALALILMAFKGQLTGEGSERSKRSDAERMAMLSAASEGFLGSPLIGQGSWFSKSRVMDRFVEIRAENAKEAGVGGFGNEGDDMAIHSQVLVGLAEGGILGGCFFIFYGLFLIWALYNLAVVRPWGRLTAMMLYVLLSGLLNVLFTPFSGAARVDIATTVGLLMFLVHEWNNREQPVKEGVVWPSR